ncbi:MAG: hypothetical protein RLZZ416_357 [Candidatus Parcubacteria bacterium]|jgi:FKBP-type peptidyl-prolyl cis-trans isomerase (trigger factor)
MSHAIRDVKISRDENAWEVAIEGEIPADVCARYREETLDEMQKDAKLDGFRPGKAPLERIIQIYGEATILRHAAEHAIRHELPQLLASEELLIIESPRVTTEEPESGKALKFKAAAALAPQVELPDYKEIAARANATKEEISVTDREHEEAMMHLRRERHRIEKLEAGVEAQKAHEESRAAPSENLPALDDEFVKSLGFESAERFSKALRANIKTEKEIQAREKRRAEILDELVEKSTVRYPPALREYELDDMEARMKGDLERMGTSYEGYLAQAKKTKEQLRDEWKDAADKRAKVRLILTEIARIETIEADKARLDEEVKRAKQHYPHADEGALRAHIAHALKNDATLEFLEKTAV